MKKLIKPISLLGILLFISIGILSCGKSNTTEKKTLRFVAMEYDTNTAPFTKKLADDYMNEHPDVKVITEVISWELGHDRLVTWINGGQAPDIANIATIDLPEYAAMNVVEPLDSYMTPDFADQFYKPILNNSGYQGKLQGLPYAVSVRALYYNKKILDDAKVEPPKNWDELIKVAQKISQPGKIYGFGVDGKDIEILQYFLYFYWANGGEVFDDSKKLQFNTPAGNEALQYLVDLIHKYKVTQPNPTGDSREDLQDLFKSGRLGMLVTGPWFFGMLDKEAPDLKYGIAPIPSNKKQITAGVTDSLIMFNTSKDKKLAWDFLKFIYKDKYRLEFDKLHGMLPEKKTVGADPYFSDHPQRKVFISQIEYAKMMPLDKDFKHIVDQMNGAIQSAYLKKKTPKDALDEITKKLNTELKR